MKFKVNEKVKIKKDLKQDDIYYMENDSNNKRNSANSVVEDMLEYLGKEAVITSAWSDDNNTGYLLDIDKSYWGWTDGMLEKVGESNG